MKVDGAGPIFLIIRMYFYEHQKRSLFVILNINSYVWPFYNNLNFECVRHCFNFSFYGLTVLDPYQQL